MHSYFFFNLYCTFKKLRAKFFACIGFPVRFLFRSSTKSAYVFLLFPNDPYSAFYIVCVAEYGSSLIYPKRVFRYAFLVRTQINILAFLVDTHSESSNDSVSGSTAETNANDNRIFYNQQTSRQPCVNCKRTQKIGISDAHKFMFGFWWITTNE